MRAGQVVGDARGDRRLVAGVGDEEDDARAEARLVLVDQAAQVLARDAGQRLGEEGHARDRLRPLRLGRAAGHRQAAAELGDLVRLRLALVEERADALGELLGAGAEERRGLGERRARRPRAAPARRRRSAPRSRRTPLAEAPSETSLKAPMSPVRATWVPPQSSSE